MSREIFADTIGAIHITGNLVRIDFMSAQPQDSKSDSKEAPPQTRTCRVIIPLEGFVSAINLQEQVVRQLTQKGVLVDGRTLPAAADDNQIKN